MEQCKNTPVVTGERASERTELYTPYYVIGQTGPLEWRAYKVVERGGKATGI